MQDSDRDKYMGEPKYRNEKGNKNPDIESFQNRTSQPEIEIQENQKKRRGNTISPRDEVRITNKNY